MFDLYCIPLGDELAIGELKREPKAVIVLCDSEGIRYVKEHTCHHVDDGVKWVDEEFCCSECGCTTSLTMSSLTVISDGELKYCPNCGAKVVEE